MNLNLKRKIDPKLAKAIEEDMAELEKKDEPKTTTKAESKPELVDCECVETGWKPGLLDQNTLCPNCQGSGKVPQVAQG